jgi:hypothetical protein
MAEERGSQYLSIKGTQFFAHKDRRKIYKFQFYKHMFLHFILFLASILIILRGSDYAFNVPMCRMTMIFQLYHIFKCKALSFNTVIP